MSVKILRSLSAYWATQKRHKRLPLGRVRILFECVQFIFSFPPRGKRAPFWGDAPAGAALEAEGWGKPYSETGFGKKKVCFAPEKIMEKKKKKYNKKMIIERERERESSENIFYY